MSFFRDVLFILNSSDKEMKIHLLGEGKNDDKVTATAVDTSTAPDDDDMSLLAQRRRAVAAAGRCEL